MTLTLEKTWRKDTRIKPHTITLHTETNAWGLWTMKELMLLGNDGIKGGLNAWTVVGSCDATQYAMDTTDYWVDYADCISSTGNHSWIVLRNAALGAGTGLEICFDYTDETSYFRELTIAYSWSAGFTGGALNARPTATDEVETQNKSTFWPNGYSWSGSVVVNRLFSSDGEVCRLFMTKGAAEYTGILALEKLKSPTSMVDNNFFILSTNAELTRALTSGTTGLYSAGVGLHKGRIDGIDVTARTSNLCQYIKDLYTQPQAIASDSNGLWITDKVKLWSNEMTRNGLIGEVFDMYNIAPLPPLHSVAGAGGDKDFFSFGEFIWGSDGTVVDG